MILRFSYNPDISVSCLVILFLIVLSCKGQSNDTLIVTSNKEQVDAVIDEIILDDYYIDKNKELKVVFSFKVDSLGEIHSAHIRWSVNLSRDAYYNICRSIENMINAKFLYLKCRDPEVVKKYVTCNYPFYPNKN